MELLATPCAYIAIFSHMYIHTCAIKHTALIVIYAPDAIQRCGKFLRFYFGYFCDCEPYACQYPLYTLPPSTLTQAKESDFFCNLVSGCSGCDPGRFSLFLPKHASSHIYDAGNFLARVCLCACVCVCVCACV